MKSTPRSATEKSIMSNFEVAVCPYRTQVTSDPSQIETTKFEVQTTKYELQIAQYGKPAYYNGVLSYESEVDENDHVPQSPHQDGKDSTKFMPLNLFNVAW